MCYISYVEPYCSIIKSNLRGIINKFYHVSPLLFKLDMEEFSMLSKLNSSGLTYIHHKLTKRHEYYVSSLCMHEHMFTYTQHWSNMDLHFGVQNYNFACHSVWVRNLVFNIKEGT
jgi:hypothetical protein